MEVLASAVGIAQLVGQTIDLIQAISRSLAQVRLAGAFINNCQAQLANLIDTLALLRDEKELHTSTIKDQVVFISGIVKGTQTSLEAIEQRQNRSKTRQFVRAFVTADDDRDMMQSHFDRLDRAVTNLNMRILTTNIGVSSDIRGLVAAWAVVQNVDKNGQRIHGQRAETALSAGMAEEAIAPQVSRTDTGGIVAGQEHTISVNYDRNEGFDNSKVINGKVGDTNYGTGTTQMISYVSNNGHQDALVINGPTSDAALAAILGRPRG